MIKIGDMVIFNKFSILPSNKYSGREAECKEDLDFGIIIDKQNAEYFHVFWLRRRCIKYFHLAMLNPGFNPNQEHYDLYHGKQ